MNEHLVEFCGWAGSILATLKYLPQAHRSYRTGRSKGIHRLTLKMWLASLLLMITYAYGISSWALFITNHVNLICWAIIFRYKFWPRTSKA